jgi:hypothetical protein
MAYGTVKVDNITFDDGGSDQNVTVSGLYNSLTSGITVTGTISGAVVIGSTSVSGTTVAGVTVTGTTVQGASGTFTSLTGTTIQGTTATYTTGSFTSLTGTTIQGTTATYTTGSFTSITGTTTTGTTANFASGVFTTSVSGTTVIASTGTFTSLTGTTTQGTTATYTTGSFTSLTGTTTTGTTSSFTSGVFTTLSGATATFTSGIIASGTAAAPSLAILADLDTGLFSPGANQLAVATNGTGRLFVDATGNVGIGANPSSLLWVRGGAATATISSSTNTSNLDLVNSSQTTRLGAINADFSIAHAGSERLRITSAGLVGVGTSSPISPLDVNGQVRAGNLQITDGTYGLDITPRAYGVQLETRGTNQAIDIRSYGTTSASYITLATQNTERLRITSAGLVGIGTSVPGALLNLQGTFGTSLTTGLRIDGLGSTTNNVSPIAFYIQSSNWGTQHAANIACGTLTGLDGGGYLRFSTSPDGNTAPAERLRITATGLVGIGTASPSQLLHLQGSDIGIFVKNTNSSGTSRLLFGNDLVSEAQIFYNGSTKSSFGGNGALTIYHGGNKPILFATANTERIRIDGSGRLLVGTSSALTGSNSQYSKVVALGNSANNAGGYFSIAAGSARGNDEDVANLWFTDNGAGEYASIRVFADGATGSGDYPGRLVFSTTADGASTPTERLRITSAGLVGIGTSSPSTPLEVAGAVGSGVISDYLSLYYPQSYGGGGSGPRMLFKANDIAGTKSTYAGIWSLLHANTVGAHSGKLVFGTTSGGNLVERLRIDESGNVGIGTTSASTILHVASTAPYIRIQDTDSSTGVTAQGGFEMYDNDGDRLFYLANESSSSSDVSLFNIAGGALKFGTSGSERGQFDSSGRLLVGTSSYTGNATIVAQGHSGDSAGPAHLLLKTGNTSPASGGDLGYLFFGDANTSGGFGAWILGQRDGGTWTSGSSMPGRLQFATTADGASSPTERMRIDSTGYIRAVGTSSTARIIPNTDNVGYLGQSSERWQAVYAVNGTIQTSDRRQKTDITEALLGSDFVKTLKPVSYKWIEGGKEPTGEIDENEDRVFTSIPGQRTHWGFIAQDVKEAVDAAGVDFGGWLLDDKDDPDSQQALRYDQFIAPLTKALQEALAEIDVLKAKVAALEAS